MATRLGIAFKAAGHQIIQVWGRNTDATSSLGKKLNANIASSFEQITRDADIYILAVSDDAIQDVARSFPHKDKLLVHTSGATPLSVLEKYITYAGVIYPLQTLSKIKEVDFIDIPIGIEASTPIHQSQLHFLAESISEKVQVISSQQRRVLHLAAVFACNFTNHLYVIAEKMLKEEGVDFDLLKPLIAETTKKALVFSPSSVKTGPASRSDYGTISAHLELLTNKDRLSSIYKLLTDSIIESLMINKD